MINIEKIMSPKPFINKDNILKHIEPIDIYRVYLDKDFKLNEVTSSPFRTDTIPSFGIYEKKGVGLKIEDQFLYNDFVLGGGDCFSFVKRLFGYSRWFEVYSRIAVDFQLDDIYLVSKGMSRIKTHKEIKNYIPEVKDNNIKIRVATRKIESFDKRFWKSYGINTSILNKYNVYPISHIFLSTDHSNEEKIIKTDKYAYAFKEYKDYKHTFKIYQPFSKYKWMNDHDSSVWQGWSQLPEEGDVLIITKSLKDVMSIVSNTSYYAISMQGESLMPKESIVDELHERFNYIIILYDNDFDKEKNWGQLFAKRICDKYEFINLMIPDKYKCKDFSDLIKSQGVNRACEILEENIRGELFRKYNSIPFLN